MSSRTFSQPSTADGPMLEYFSILDLAPVDLMNHAGFAGELSAKGWYPVVVAETIRFRKSLGLSASSIHIWSTEWIQIWNANQAT